MNDSEMSQYLANVLSIARADGVLSPQEEAAIEEVRIELKAKKKDLSQASKLAATPNFRPMAVGRFSDKVKNIEDMLYLAFADGKLDEAEKQIVVAFAKNIGVVQEQINQIVSEVKFRVANKDVISICPACHKKVPASCKFCPECGLLVKQKQGPGGTNLEFDYPSQGISIEFSESSSANFHTALLAAQAAHGFQECQRGKKKWYLATWPNNNITETLDLVGNLKGFRNRKVYVNGEPLAWDEVFGFLWCYRQRQQAYRPVEYCFGVDDKNLNIWGCKQSNMDWTNWARWFSYGHFREKDVFVFDKSRIRHEIETNLYKVRFCPHLRFQLASKSLELLPDMVRVSDQTGWKYNENYEQVPNSIKIVQKTKENGIMFKNEFYADGVRPIGFFVALEILKEALKACSISDVDVRQLTG